MKEREKEITIKVKGDGVKLSLIDGRIITSTKFKVEDKQDSAWVDNILSMVDSLLTKHNNHDKHNNKDT